jgi:two-component system, OmpR family, sensor kinase
VRTRLRTLRWRLTLLYAGLLALLLVGLGLFLANQAENLLVAAEVERLRDLAQPALFRPGPPGRIDEDPARIAGNLSRALFGTEIQGLVLDSSGRPITVHEGPAPPLTGSVIPTVAYRSIMASGRPTTIIMPGDAGRARTLVVLIPVRSGSETIGLVQLSTPFREVDALLGRFRTLLLLGIGGALGIALLIGLPLARLLLRPLERMVDTTRQIADGDWSRRVELRHGDDEIGQLAAAFDHMLDRIEAAMRVREESEARAKQFAADASHELRSPLTAVSGYADVLLHGMADDPATAEHVLRSMRREIDRMGRLVEDLLTLTRLDAGTGLLVDEVDLSDVVAEAGERARLLSDGPTVTVQTDRPLVVRGDSDRLAQVVTNLLDNALRHTPPDGRVELAATSVNGHARLIVRDTGPGIAPKHLPRIFDRFYRPDPARARATGSAGLGLAIVQAIVQAHGGRVAVESEPGEGATFTVGVPLASASAVRSLSELSQSSQANLTNAW